MTSKTSRETEQLVASILNKSWDELEALEIDERLLFRDVLVRRRGDGQWENIPVMLRVPREHELRRARIDARAWAEEEGLDPKLDADLFDNMDTLCTLAISIRNATAPFEPYVPDAKELEKKYDKVCLERIWATLDALRQIIDPRPSDISEEQLWILIGALAKAKNVLPLVAFAGDSQNTCIVTMASELLKLRDSK